MKKHALDIVIPIFNNSNVLRNSITQQIKFYRTNLKNYNWHIILLDNASTDTTRIVGQKLAQQYPEVIYSFIKEKGRGIALRTAWSRSTADFVSYMDVDLATNLNAFPELLRRLADGGDVAVGSKYMVGARAQRHWLRLLLSRIFNVLAPIFLGVHFTDAQCGFKALSRSAACQLLPLIKDNIWFFDTELLYFAEKLGMKISEVPVTWVENRDSSVNLFGTVFSFLVKLILLRLRRIPYQNND